MMMDHSSCQWVRQWLPLLVEDGDAAARDGADLSAAEQSRIRRHLADCASCRDYRSRLTDVLSVLSGVAAEMPLERDAHSLWPDLEARLLRHQVQPSGRWRRWASILSARAVGNAANRLCQEAGLVLGELPLRLAWGRDSLQERVRLITESGGPAAFALARLAVGMSVLALMSLTIAVLAHRQRSRAEAEMVENAQSIPNMDWERSFTWPRLPEVPAVAKSDPAPSAVVPDMLAQADASPTREALASAASPPARPASAPVAPSTSSLPTASSYDFDLEQGTPMPPETRGGKPAY
jgi:hypothetical protein